MEFITGSGRERIVFHPDVLNHFMNYRQLTATAREAGGQLFAVIANGRIEVVAATGPYPVDKRGRFSFSPSRFKERLDIFCMYRRGLHYVGDWHTHPEPKPTPSSIDVANIREIFAKSRHHYSGILLVIVGQLPIPDGIYAAIANEDSVVQVHPTATPAKLEVP